MKNLIVALFCAFLFLFTSFCSAQPLKNPVPPDPSSKPTRRTDRKFGITFLSTDTCNLRINGDDYGKIPESKTIPLPFGRYRFFFESLETGETVTRRVFDLTGDSLKNGKYTFQVRFRPHE